jgi:hypothetical protein
MWYLAESFVQVAQREDLMDDPAREHDATGDTPEPSDGGSPSVDTGSTGNGKGLLSDDRIARRAYQRFADRGWEHGHDLDDWLDAERELTSGEEQ